MQHITSNSLHTLVVSDLHLADCESPDPSRPLWKKFRRKEYIIDESFNNFLKFMQQKILNSTIELVLNGDIFDFDSITASPKNPNYKVIQFEKKFGLGPSEEKSSFKMGLIIADHPIWFRALSEFIHNGNHVIFIIGNHDIELYWPKVQQMIIDHLNLSENFRHHIRFCEWFYVSKGDTLIEHGHQYDPYCMTLNPIYPMIKKNGEYKIRLPFGNLANRYMVNGMGLKNPHSDDSFIKSAYEFAKFFYEYEMRVQPFMIFTWFFGALRTLITSINEGLYPSQKDPLMFEDRIKQIAARANTAPSVVLALRENHAHPAVHRPLMILQELWLDRTFLLLLILAACWQFFTTSHLFVSLSLWWFLVPLFCFVPFFIYYAHGVKSEVRSNAHKAFKRTPLSARAAKVERVIHGHTHIEGHFNLRSGIEYLNTGTWTPRFLDPECNIPYGNRLFGWINGDENRHLGLYYWQEDKIDKWSDGPTKNIPSKLIDVPEILQ